MDGIDTSVPQTARIWNYLLGGSDNFPVDRQVGEQLLEVFPDMAANARAGRALLVRVVTYLAAEAGVRQFLDVGSGLPTADNTHEIAQRIAPEARIVYVDVDPLVLRQARGLLTSTPEGASRYVEADARDAARVLTEAGRTLDLSRPVGLIFSGILGHITDDAEAVAMVRSYVAALVPGSYVMALDGSLSAEHRDAETVWNENANPPYVVRSHSTFARFFDGLELVDPGVVSVALWRPDTPGPRPIDVVCGVGRKP